MLSISFKDFLLIMSLWVINFFHALVLTGFIFGKDIIYGFELFVFSSKLRFDFILSSLSFIGAI